MRRGRRCGHESAVALLVLLSMMVLGAAVANASDGDLDPSFGTNGIVTTSIRGFEDGNAIAVQPDGKIVVVGYSTAASGERFALARYNADGTLDTSFNHKGTVTTSMSTGANARAVAIQPDGKIVVAGHAHTSGDTDFAIARYNSDGSLDTSFDSDGKVLASFGTGSDIALAVAIQPDGRILAAGRASPSGTERIALVRYNTDGSLDTSFDSDGRLETSIGFASSASAVSILTGGKLLVGGASASTYLPDFRLNYDFTLVRYNQNGSLDATFDSDGVVTTEFTPGGMEGAQDMIVQPDGKIILFGMGDGFTLARYNPDGSLDTTFDGDGMVTTHLGGPGPDSGSSLDLQDNGRIVAAGTSELDSDRAFSIARYNPDGGLDPTFDGDGKLISDVTPWTDTLNGIAIQEDDKVLAVGSSSDPAGDVISLARYQADATPPDTFITSMPASPVNVVSASVSFSSSQTPSTYRCRLDTASWDPCTSPATYWSLSEGTHSLEVRAEDGSENPDPTPAIATWTIDLTPPETSIDSRPSDPSTDLQPTFTFSSQDGSRFRCWLDGRRLPRSGRRTTHRLCASPLQASVEPGRHTLEVAAIDDAGNIDPSRASYTWTVSG